MNAFEIDILESIQDIFQSEWMDTIMKFITHLGDGGYLLMAFTLILLLIPKTRKLGLTVFISLVIEALVCNVITKPLVARTRPYDYYDGARLLIAKQKDYSFPSGHTGASFAVATALLCRKSKLWIPVGILAVLIGFSRMYVYVHFPTDVLGGAILGIISGVLAALIVKKEPYKKLFNKG